MHTESDWASFGGRLSVHDHESITLGCTMRFAVYVPPQAKQAPCPVLWYLSGLTCSWANVMEKSGLQRYASEHGVIVVAPDTSPRGDAVADDDAYDLGQGAGFYLTATQAPWASHYKMDDYITGELSDLVLAEFPGAADRQGIFGHSMGGHGALTLHLKHQERYRSVSAFSPISSPSSVPWGEKAFSTYLGDDRSQWANYDASELVKRASSKAEMLIDTGDADPFLKDQLRPELFEAVCDEHGQALRSRMHGGYDHSYWFIASFIGEHIAHHAQVLNGR